jgi:hypothetical protein
MYLTDHPPLHVHVFGDEGELDRWDIEHQRFMDGTIGSHRGRVLRALRELGFAK